MRPTARTTAILITLLAATLGSLGCRSQVPPVTRVATFNVEDLRTDDLTRPDNPRLRAIAATIRRIRPDVILINEIAHDQPGVPGYDPAAGPGHNADRLAALLATPAEPGLAPRRYQTVMLPSNTGLASNHDLDHSGAAVTTYPAPPPAATDGTPARQTPEGIAFGNDAWGFGTFPGQYAMALLVDARLKILTDQIRTFRTFPWRAMPGNRMPTDPATGRPWYDDEAAARMPLSSKSHWDVPIRFPNGTVVHILASHPTPPAFDGPERRNKARNHDEIRFWADYIDNADYITDDAGTPGGLPPNTHFVILGDLNADPDEGSGEPGAIAQLLDHPAITDPHPTADIPVEGLDPDDTARFGLRVDYVLPSRPITVLGAGIARPEPPATAPSDHFPVWVDLVIPEVD